MASPIFPGVGTQSRIAQVQQGQSDLSLRQEALNRSSGQGLLGLGLQGTLGLGSLLNTAVQQALDRKAGLDEGAAERKAALAQIIETGGQARDTARAGAIDRSSEANRAARRTTAENIRGEGVQSAENRLQEKARLEETKESQRLRNEGLSASGSLAAKKLEISDRPARLSAENAAATEQAEAARQFARDPITFLEDQLKQTLITIQNLLEQRDAIGAEKVRTEEIPRLLELFEVLSQGDPGAAERAPVLSLLLQQKTSEDFQPGGQKFSGPLPDRSNAELLDAVERTARIRARRLNPIETSTIPGIPGVPGDFGGRRGF